LLLALVTVAVTSVLAPPSALAARRVFRVYEGTTSAGGRIVLIASVRDGVVRFQGVGLEEIATCDDGTTPAISHGLGFEPRGLPIDGRTLDLELLGFSDSFEVDGTLGPRRGTGTVTHLFAALDPSEQPQLCTTGELRWQVERTDTFSPLSSSSAVLTETRAGVTETAFLGGAAPAAAALAERLRSYEGQTSTGHPVFVATAKRATHVELRELGFGWHLACDDATSSVDLGFFILFGGEILEDGQVHYGSSDPEIALHVDGRVGVHRGAGTTSVTIPALTEDRQAQACRSGELTWTVERVG
jgi:hypothetical protein